MLREHAREREQGGHTGAIVERAVVHRVPAHGGADAVCIPVRAQHDVLVPEPWVAAGHGGNDVV